MARHTDRRGFLIQTGGTLAAAASLAEGAMATTADGVVLVRDPADPVAGAAPAAWAAGQLRQALQAKGVAVREAARLEEGRPGERCVLVTGPTAPATQGVLQASRVPLPQGAESFTIAAATGTPPVLVVCGADARGLVYALLDLMDAVGFAGAPLAALESPRQPVRGRPHNTIRSIARIFSSVVEDRGWFNDRAFWERYLTMLATERFNRFALMFGMAYDFLREVSDSYFHFAYPFLLAVPGHEGVRATNLPDAERDSNLAMLRYISDAAAERGLHFQLGLWTHGYDWSANQGVNHFIVGLNQENHAAYCRDALKTLLQACPSIQGITFRIHGESGVAEGSLAFWKTVFDGIVQCGRRVEIDMHAKGIEDALIDATLATGMPTSVSPKFWAEHMGLPYHQAAIRALELPPAGKADTGFFAKSDGSRRFLRYGYGDLLREDRRYGILHRLWPGTQRLLLWGDPATAAAYSRAASFCGSLGMEICEPLSFKGRKGSGLPGGREAYADAALRSDGGADWDKYRYTYRLWGRLLYAPDTDPSAWRRLTDAEFGAAAGAVEAALSHASRILPLVTTAHLPSAANNIYWPEMYTNMPVVDEKRPHPYGDSPTPKRFDTVSPLDPELFSPITEFVAGLLDGKPDARYSPVEVAAWLEAEAEEADKQLTRARREVKDPNTPAFRRLAADIAIQAGLGRFFADKLRAGTLFAVYERTGSMHALSLAIEAYRAARGAMATVSAVAEGVYVRDVTFGRVPNLRGHWADRLMAIDEDIADMVARQQVNGNTAGTAEAALRAIRTPPARPAVGVTHTPPALFRRGEPVLIEAVIHRADRDAAIRLRYRRANQAEPWQSMEMVRAEGSRHPEGIRFRATIPASYTDTPFPLLYHFETQKQGEQGSAGRWQRYPGFTSDRTNPPYFAVRQAPNRPSR